MPTVNSVRHEMEINMCSTLAVRVTGLYLALSALVASAAAFDPKPKLDLVRSVLYDQGGSATFDVVYRAGDLRPTGMQFDIEYGDASRVIVAAGPTAEFASKILTVAGIDRNHKRVLVFGLNSEVLWDGVLAVITLFPGDDIQDPLTIHLTSIVAVDQNLVGVALDPVEIKTSAAGWSRPKLGLRSSAYPFPGLPVYATVPCTSDVNGDGKVDVADLQLLVAMTADAAYGRCDLNGDGKLSVDDFQLVLSAIPGAEQGLRPRAVIERKEP